MNSFFGDGDVSGWMIVDCMMNIPLLYWASEETKDPRFAHIALKHAKTAQRYVVREDGSCNHIVGINPQTGEFSDRGMRRALPGAAGSRGPCMASR